MTPVIRWKGKEYLLINGHDGRDEGAIATREQWESFSMNDYHLNKDGTITSFGEVVGNKEEIEFLGEEE